MFSSYSYRHFHLSECKEDIVLLHTFLCNKDKDMVTGSLKLSSWESNAFVAVFSNEWNGTVMNGIQWFKSSGEKCNGM